MDADLLLLMHYLGGPELLPPSSPSANIWKDESCLFALKHKS